MAIAVQKQRTQQQHTQKKPWTDAEFMALSKAGHQYELVNGELVDMGNSGMEHGELGAFLAGVLAIHCRKNRLGVVCESSTAFTLANGDRRSPDISFVDKKRLQGLTRLPKGYFQGTPDLAVEILSPNNTVEEIHTKIVEYFENDTHLVWVIHPDEKYVLVYHSPQPDKLLCMTDTLDGEDRIPGFSIPLSELFQDWSF